MFSRISEFFEPDYFTRSIPRFFKKTIPRFFTQKIPNFFENRIAEKFFSYLRYAIRPIDTWIQMYSNVTNMVSNSLPNSFIKHCENALGFIYGDDDLNGARIAGGFVADEQDASFTELIDEQWYRLLNPFHLANMTIAFIRACLFGSMDGLDRCLLPSGSFAAKQTHGFFEFWKVLFNFAFMFMELFVTTPLKLAGDVTDTALYAALSIVYAPLRFLVGCVQGLGYLVKQCCCSSSNEDIQRHVRFDENAVEQIKAEMSDEKKSAVQQRVTPSNELIIPIPKNSVVITPPVTPSSRRKTLQREPITHDKVKAALESRKHSRQPSTGVPLQTSVSEKNLLRTQAAFHRREGSKSLQNLKLAEEPVLTIQVNDNSYTATSSNPTTVSGSPSTLSPLEVNSISQSDRNKFFSSNSLIPGAVNISPKNAQLSS